MRASESPHPSKPPSERRQRPDAPRLRLDQLRRGQTRALALRLTEVRGSEKIPTENCLDLKITCDVPGRVYYVDVKAEFGPKPPRLARLSILCNRSDTMAPVMLVENGVSVEKGLTIEVDESTQRLIFWVATESAIGVQSKLAAAIHVCPPPTAEQPDDLDTMRLPTTRQVVKEHLAHALAASASPALRILGELLTADAPLRKMRLLERLVVVQADVRLAEAAVRDFDLCEEVVQGFGAVDFASLCFSDPAHASVVIFHPRSPPYLVQECLVVACARKDDPAPADQHRMWRQLITAAAIILQRRAPKLLSEVIEELVVAGDSTTPSFLRRLVAGVAYATKPPAPSGPERSLDESLQRIGGTDADAAVREAVAVLAHAGFVGVSAEMELEDGESA